MPKQLLILAHGAWHDFSGFSAWAEPFLSGCGYTVTCSSDPDSLLTLSQDKVDAVVSYTALGNVTDDKGNTGKDLSGEQVSSLRTWLRAGHGYVPVHCATVSDEDAHAYHALVGGRFLTHPEAHTFTVYPGPQDHPVTAGVGAFEVFDELYQQETTEDIAVHMATLYEKKWYPMVWSRREGEGRVVHIAPGHFPAVWNSEAFGKLLRQATRWVCLE